jgi:hypothetical protein
MEGNEALYNQHAPREGSSLRHSRLEGRQYPRGLLGPNVSLEGGEETQLVAEHALHQMAFAMASHVAATNHAGDPRRSQAPKAKPGPLALIPAKSKIQAERQGCAPRASATNS